MTVLRERPTNRLLGYPDDARLLIINADDFGMCHSINGATVQAWKAGVVTSTSLMTPCSWAPHAMRLLKENPGFPFGVHLTLISEYHDYRWGPKASRDKVSSLVDETGCFYTEDRSPELLAQATIDEVELEFRTQIESVLAAGLKPTHLDFHCLADGGRSDIFELTFALAREHGLALRVSDRRLAGQCHHAGLPANDHDVLDSFNLPLAGKPAHYAQMLRELPAGLSEWAVHVSLGNAESQAIDPDKWQVRRTDFDFVVSPEARDILSEEGIVLLDYRALQAVWSRRS